MLAQHQFSGLEVGKRLGEDTTRTADPYSSCCMMSCSEIKALGKEEEGQTLMVMALATQYGDPAFQEVVGHLPAYGK